ncbi:hypothetical protein ACROYT_G012812 [Oculina patagonica]
MHRKLKYGIVILQWKMMFMTRRELHLAGIIVAALITTLVTNHFIKPSSSQSTEPPTFSNSRFSPNHNCKSWKTSPQHKTTLITKNACERNYFLLVLVSSAPANYERRNLIRQTWGVDDDAAPRWKTYFLLGQTTNQTLSDLLHKENNQYGDMIRAGYYEHYWNQSLKIQMAFEWAARYCNYSFLLKADDDVLVNTKDLVQFLQRRSTPRKGLYMGKRHYNPEVPRDGKFNVTYEEYSDTHYPDFCSGASIVMTYDVVECLVPLFDVIKPYRMDDVYVGLLVNRSGVTPVHHNGFIIPFSYDVDDCDFVPNTLRPLTGNFERRNLIRQTWGADNSTAPQWKTYFLLGQTTNQKHSDSVKTESDIYGDIIRADYYEHYWKQSLKIQMAFEWAARYCKFSFLFKADDDVLVNTKDLVQFLQRKTTPKEGLFMGRLHPNPIVRRAGKWNVSYEEYNHTHYPDFCSGAGFVMSYDVIECLVPLFDVIKPYRMDDVYVGMLANRSGVIAVDHSGFYMPIDDYDDCIYVPNTLAQHRATGQCLLKLLRLHSEDFFYGTRLGSYF